MNDPAIVKLIDQDLADAKTLNVRKTPGFLSMETHFKILAISNYSNWFIVIPAAVSFTPGLLTRPDTENARGQGRSLRPWLLYHAGPFSMMSRTQNNVSALLISVGMPNSPTTVGRGSLSLGYPRFPSMDSSIAERSPQI